MFIRLSKNAFVRQYGPYTHIYNQLNKFDETYQDASIFIGSISRDSSVVSDVVKRVVDAYERKYQKIVEKDFNAFVTHLCSVGVLVKGESDSELETNDISFTYNVEDPVTSPDMGERSAQNDEGVEHKLLHSYFENNPTPFSLHIDITSECNERCVHCYVPRHKHHYIDVEKVCEVISEFRDMQGMQLTISGGECLLHPQFECILRHARLCDLSVTVLSNLILCDEKKAKLLKEMNLSLVQTSLYSMDSEVHDAITRLPGSFYKTKSAIELLHSLDVPVQISCPCMKLNYKGYKDVLNFAYSLKMKAYTDYIMMARSDGTSDNLENRLSISESASIIRSILENEAEMQVALHNNDTTQESDEEFARRRMCGVGVDSICLNADGNYYPCSGFQGYPVGNCFKNTFREVWENSQQLRYLRSLRRGDISKCVKCADRDYCSMCLVRNFNETRDMLQVGDHFCRVAHINHELVDEYRSRFVNV